MKWKHPKDGDRKIKRKFALLPITINYETRWLEWVNVEYEYCQEIFFSYWAANKFIDEEIDETANV